MGATVLHYNRSTTWEVVKEKEAAKVAKMVAKEDAVPREERTVARERERERAKDPREARMVARERAREEPRW